MTNHLRAGLLVSPFFLLLSQTTALWANAALGELTSDKMSHLGTGEAYVWSSKASDDSFTRGAVKIKCRPRITQHGGSTKTAVGR